MRIIHGTEKRIDADVQFLGGTVSWHVDGLSLLFEDKGVYEDFRRDYEARNTLNWSVTLAVTIGHPTLLVRRK